MTNLTKKKLISLIFTLTLCLVLAVSCTTTTGTKNSNNIANAKTISVSGTGTVKLEANIVSFRIGVTETANTTKEAQQAANMKMSSILSILRENGIKDEDIATTALSFSTNYSWRDGVQTKIGEEVSQTVYVRLYNTDTFAQLADSIGSAVSGISFYNVSFDSTERKKAENQARDLAYKDAFAKAQIYATAAGLTLGDPISIQDGYSSYAQNSMDTTAVMYSAKAAMEEETTYSTETPTGPLTVSSTVQIVFELK